MENKDFLLSRIKIKGLFGYKDIDWELFQDVNILGGINGSGKSTILKCVDSVLQNGYLDEDLLDLIEEIEIYFTNDIKIRVEKIVSRLNDFTPESCYEYHYSKQPNNEGAFFIQEIQVKREESLIKLVEIKELYKNCFIASFDNKIISESVLSGLDNKKIKTILDLMIYNQIVKRNELIIESSDFFENIKDFDKLRLLVSEKLKKDYIVELLNELNEDIHSKYNYTLPDALGKGLTDKDISGFMEDKNSRSATFLKKKFKDLVNEQIDDAQVRVDTLSSIYTYIDSLFNDKKIARNSASFDFEMEDKIISCYNLSTGEKQLLLILLIVFNTMKKPCILLMDEPDLGMHITWKEKFITTLRKINPNAQIILTTHAPSMVRGWVDNVKEIKQITVN